MKTASKEISGAKRGNTPANGVKRQEPAKIAEIECFPAIADAYSGGYGIVTRGDHRGCRVKLGGRVQTGGGICGAKFSRYVQYQCAHTCALPRCAWALLPESEFVSVMKPYVLFPELEGYWYGVSDRDDRAIALYERHYSCVHAGRRLSREVTPPGESMVLLGANNDALWVWSKEKHRRDGQHGINCNVFRNESAVKSSLLIQEAMAIAWQRWPGERLFTFVDASKIRSSNPGYCFKSAGWHKCGVTKRRGLLILECLSAEQALAVVADRRAA